MTYIRGVTGVDSFPRRQARTRRFTLGAPRNIRVSDDGSRVAFLRSSGPEDPVNALWVLDVASGVERLAADPRRLDADGRASSGRGSAEDALPAAERARRERVRESGSGIVSYDADPRLTTAVFALAGTLWRVDLGTGEAVVLAARPGAFDPRLAPDCRRVAYVCGSALRITGDGPDCEVIAESRDTDAVTWGLAEFVAAEEMGRTRGHWWSPQGRRLLAARVDAAPVKRWWISAPAEPEAAPSEVRYPAAGTANAVVGLAVFDVSDLGLVETLRAEPSLCGVEHLACPAMTSEKNEKPGVEPRRVGVEPRRVDVAWDADGWEYLAAVDWSAEGLLLTVQTRDQRKLAVLDADPDTGVCSTRYQVSDDAWVELVPGVPRLAGGRLVTVEDRGPARRLCADGQAITPDHVQVRRVEHADEAGAIVTASVDPTDVNVASIGWDGAIEWLTVGRGVNSAAAGGSTAVITRQSMNRPGLRCTVHSIGGRAVSTLGGKAGAAREPPSSLRHARQGVISGGVDNGVAETRKARRENRNIHQIASHAADPGINLNVRIVALGPKRLATAIVMAARAHPAEPLPVLVDPYGGPHAQRVLHAQAQYHTSQWFADQGFAVVVIDGRGTPGRGPDFERAVSGDLAGPVLEDQIEGLHAAARLEPRLDLSRVAIRGWSFGGYLAALAVLRRPDVFGAAIAGAPVTDWRLYDTHYTERYLGHPDETPANYLRTDLIRLAPRLRQPLMLIHGLADDNVVSAHTLRLSQALLEAGRLHTVLPLSGVTHMTSQEQVAENLLLVQLRFLRSALGLR